MLGGDTAAASFVTGEETGCFGRFGCTSCDSGVGGFFGWDRGGLDFVTPGKTFVVETLT